MRRKIFTIIAFFSFAFPSVAHEDDGTFEDRVRAFILNNPEIIVEALTVLSEREARAETIARLAEYPDLFTDPPRLGEGNPVAPLRVIEFFDYNCAPCKAVHPALVAFTEKHPEVRIEMRHLPILSPGSERATRFALATQIAYGDDAHRAVHDALWDMRGPLNAAGFKRIADELSFDFQRIEPLIESDEVTARIDYNRDVAITLEVLGTPAFLTPDSVVFGSTEIEELSELWLNR